MRKYWIIGGSVVGGLVVLAALAVLVIPNLIPQEVYRAEIEKVAYQVTGRKVTVTGRIDVAVFPRIEARAGASTIANPEGFAGTDFASMKELRAAVKSPAAPRRRAGGPELYSGARLCDAPPDEAEAASVGVCVGAGPGRGRHCGAPCGGRAAAGWASA